MVRYLTRQRKQLLKYLSEHTDEQMTARQIADALTAESISISAVYRNISALEEEGILKRSIREKAPERCIINILPQRNVRTVCIYPVGYAAKAFILEKRKRRSFCRARWKAQAFKSTKRKRFCMAFVPIAENKRVENRRVVSRMERKKRNRIAALLLAVTILVIHALTLLLLLRQKPTTIA